DSFTDLLNNMKQVTLGAYEHQVYPFDELLDELKLNRDMSRSALFDVMVVLQNTGKDSGEQPDQHGNLQPEHYAEVSNVVSQFDLSFVFKEAGNCIQVTIEYNTDIFGRERIERLLQHFISCLKQISIYPEAPLTRLNYLSSEETKILLEGFNDTHADYPKDKVLVDLFEVQVMRTPDHPAVVFEEAELSYSELNARSNQLASYLRNTYQIKREDLVGISVPRGPWMVIAALGVLKSGGAYVPIDPDYPEERIDYMISDSGCKVMLDTLELEKFSKIADEYERGNLTKNNEPGDLAYVIYTSGSTGNPKGVMIEHHSLLDYALTFKYKFNLDENDRMIQQSSMSFDTHVEEMYPILLSGGALLIAENGGKDIGGLLELIHNKNATLLSTTPSVLNELNLPGNDFNKLRALISGGDRLDYSSVSNLAGKINVYNSYGPSEATVCCTFAEIKEAGTVLPIGSPMANTQIYILDEHRNLLPVGVAGEICIGGNGLARGYLNRPELTSEKFIVHPFKKGGRIYKTGDLGRWLPDGSIEFIGRKDDQVKIRGYRIELGEIEHVLQQQPHVESCVVMARNNSKEEKVLVAYVVSKETLNTSDLRTRLENSLPAYMVPLYFVQIDSMPLSANGKINRKALPHQMEPGMGNGREYIAARNETEKLLVEIWSELLGIEQKQISVRDNFFELGGHSLTAMKLHSILNKSKTNSIMEIRLQSMLPESSSFNIKLKDIFNNPTIEQLALNNFNSHHDANSTLLHLSQHLHPDRMNMYFIPPVFGHSSIYKPISNKLVAEFNCYGLNYRGLEKGEKFYHSIEQIAAEFAEQLIAKQQEADNFVIFGYSMGALIAFEMAKKLESRYKNISMIIVDKNAHLTRQNTIKSLFRKGEVSELFLSYKEIMPYETNNDKEIKAFLSNNIRLANKYKQRGQISSDLYAFECKYTKMTEWEKLTNGRFNLEYIEGDHWQALSEDNMTKITAAAHLIKRNFIKHN
ncbi:MAG: Nonribosomal peptide synthetase, partial [Bacteroidetes bacterium]|nr:Nonribosomal peptide synthetase [Bacteroidota bacterium]